MLAMAHFVIAQKIYFENFMGIFLKFRLDAMGKRVMIVCVICWTILKKHYDPSKSKTLTQFSGLVIVDNVAESFLPLSFTLEKIGRCKLPPR